MAQLYLDLDGVLADFEHGARMLLGMDAKDHQALYGPGAFWKQLSNARGFYENLPLLPDAMELFRAVQHLKPTVLTGLPIGKWAEPQKRAWAARHLPGVPVITTLARKKSTFCKPGDVLVDDQAKYRDLWEAAGGIFVLHTSAAASIQALKELGILNEQA